MDKRAWPILLAAKLAMALVVVACLFLTDFNVHQFQAVFARWPDSDTPTWASRFATWDVAHYLRLSQEGYQPNSTSCAFYPLWPMVLRLATGLTGGQPVLVAMLLTNILSLVGLWMLYRLVLDHYGGATARDTLILVLAFPGALFFSFPYSESLFLTLLITFFWSLDRARWEWAVITAFLLPLSRPVGVFVALPLAWFLWEQGWPRWPALRRVLQRLARAVAVLPWQRPRDVAAAPHRKAASSHPVAGKSVDTVFGGDTAARDGAAREPGGFMPWLLLAAPWLGYGLYFGLMYVWTGNSFEGFAAQKAYPNSPSIKNMFNVSGFTQALLNIGSLAGMMDGFLDRAFFVMVLLTLPAIWRLNRVWFWYVLAAGLVPALTSWFMSYRRYVMVLFPVFVVLAQWLGRLGSRWVFWYYVVLLAAIQAWAVKEFVSFNWAG